MPAWADDPLRLEGLRPSRVLIVEDDPISRTVIEAFLHEARYDLIFAEDAVHATTLATRHQPDGIVLDLCLPGGNGFRVIERLQTNARTCRIPILVITALDAKHAVAALAQFKTGITYLQKPLTRAGFLRAVTELLHRS